MKLRTDEIDITKIREYYIKKKLEQSLMPEKFQILQRWSKFSKKNEK